MATELQAATWIAASPDRVWRVLADLAYYPQWNPFVLSATGALYEGELLRVRLHPRGLRPRTARLALVSVVPGQELRGTGSLGVRGLLDTDHSVLLQPLGRGTHLVQRARFTGLLAPVVRPHVVDGLQHSLEAMNAALRTRAEQVAATADDLSEPADLAAPPDLGEPVDPEAV